MRVGFGIIRKIIRNWDYREWDYNREYWVLFDGGIFRERVLERGSRVGVCVRESGMGIIFCPSESVRKLFVYDFTLVSDLKINPSQSLSRRYPVVQRLIFIKAMTSILTSVKLLSPMRTLNELPPSSPDGHFSSFGLW